MPTLRELSHLLVPGASERSQTISKSSDIPITAASTIVRTHTKRKSCKKDSTREEERQTRRGKQKSGPQAFPQKLGGTAKDNHHRQSHEKRKRAATSDPFFPPTCSPRHGMHLRSASSRAGRLPSRETHASPHCRSNPSQRMPATPHIESPATPRRNIGCRSLDKQPLTPSHGVAGSLVSSGSWIHKRAMSGFAFLSSSC